MQKVQNLETSVEKLYKPNSTDDEFSKYFKSTMFWHVLLVEKYSHEIYRKEKNGRLDLILAGALTHDISDAVVYRHSKDSDLVGEDFQLRLMLESGYSKDEVSFVKKEITDVHSCRDIFPSKIEGKIVASADAMAHLNSDFYLRFCWDHMPKGKVETLQDYKNWVLSKIERDYNNKIFFDWLKKDMKDNYISLKRIFSM